MNFYIVETIYYKTRFLVAALSDTGAKMRVMEHLSRNRINVKITELEAVRISTFMNGETVRAI